MGPILKRFGLSADWKPSEVALSVALNGLYPAKGSRVMQSEYLKEGLAKVAGNGGFASIGVAALSWRPLRWGIPRRIAVSAPLFGWLEPGAEDRSRPIFTLTEVRETVAFEPTIQARIVAELESARINDAFRNRLQARLTKEKYARVVAAAAPAGNRETTRKGDFGEVVSALSMSHHFGYEVPIKRLRYKQRSGDLLTGIDVVAFRRDPTDGAITEMCYVESKLRTTEDPYAATGGHTQLRESWVSTCSELAIFIGNVLAERNDPLLEPFVDFLANESGGKSSFCIAVHTDAAAWSPNTVAQLESVTNPLTPLHLVVYHIADLADRVRACFDALGMDVDDTDD
jgi:hypothetical protein